MIRLYGSNSGSFQTVTEGMKLALEELGLLSGFSAGDGMDFDSTVPGADAPVSLTVGPPLNVLTAHVKGMHQKHSLMLAPNSEGIPPQLKGDLAADMYSEAQGKRVPIVDVFLAPSWWAKGVLEREFPNHEVLLCQHGVLPSFKFEAARRERVKKNYIEDKQFNVIHFTSSKLSRKGTAELVKAWKDLLLSVGEQASGESDRFSCRLDIMCNPAYAQDYFKYQSDTVKIHPSQGFTFEQLKNGIAAYHLVVQPSRAEGFGLIPLEARACGVPVLYTSNTGHLDHSINAERSGCVLVTSSFLEESDDFWGAEAPGIRSSYISSGLIEVFNRWLLLEATANDCADEIRKNWTWSGRALSALNKLTEEFKK